MNRKSVKAPTGLPRVVASATGAVSKPTPEHDADTTNVAQPDAPAKPAAQEAEGKVVGIRIDAGQTTLIRATPSAPGGSAQPETMLRALRRDEVEVRMARYYALVEKGRKILTGTLIVQRHKGKLIRKR